MIQDSFPLDRVLLSRMLAMPDDETTEQPDDQPVPPNTGFAVGVLQKG